MNLYLRYIILICILLFSLMCICTDVYTLDDYCRIKYLTLCRDDMQLSSHDYLICYNFYKKCIDLI